MSKYEQYPSWYRRKVYPWIWKIWIWKIEDWLIFEHQKLREDFRNKRNEFSELLSYKFEEVNDLKQQIVSLEKLEDYINDADAYKRRDAIIIAGPNLPVSV